MTTPLAKAERLLSSEDDNSIALELELNSSKALAIVNKNTERLAPFPIHLPAKAGSPLEKKIMGVSQWLVPAVHLVLL